MAEIRDENLKFGRNETPMEICEKLSKELENEMEKRRRLKSGTMSVCFDDIGAEERKQKIIEMKKEIKYSKAHQEALVLEKKIYKEGILEYNEKIEKEKVNYDEFKLDFLEWENNIMDKIDKNIRKEDLFVEYLELELNRLKKNRLKKKDRSVHRETKLRYENIKPKCGFSLEEGHINTSLWNDHFLATAGSEFKIWSADLKDVHLITTLTGNKEEITSIDSRNDYLQYSFLASSGKSLHLWQMPPKFVKKPKILPIHVTYEGHEEKVTKTSFIPCHRDLLASCSMDKTIRVWDRTKKNSIANVSLDLPCTNLACTHSSIITAQNKKFYIFDNKSLIKLQESCELDSPISSVEVSPNGTYLILNLPEIKSMACIDLRTFNIVKRYSPSCLGMEWRCPKFSPSGNYLAAGMEGASPVVIWNHQSKPECEIWTNSGDDFASWSWSPNGDHILACYKNKGEIIRLE